MLSTVYLKTTVHFNPKIFLRKYEMIGYLSIWNVLKQDKQNIIENRRLFFLSSWLFFALIDECIVYNDTLIGSRSGITAKEYRQVNKPKDVYNSVEFSGENHPLRLSTNPQFLSPNKNVIPTREGNYYTNADLIVDDSDVCPYECCVEAEKKLIKIRLLLNSLFQNTMLWKWRLFAMTRRYSLASWQEIPPLR